MDARPAVVAAFAQVQAGIEHRPARSQTGANRGRLKPVAAGGVGLNQFVLALPSGLPNPGHCECDRAAFAANYPLNIFVMKSTNPLNRRALAKFAVLTLTLSLTLPALLCAAPLNVTVSANVSISDAQSTNLFAGATVTENTDHAVSVWVDFSPANLGSLNLPPEWLGGEWHQRAHGDQCRRRAGVLAAGWIYAGAQLHSRAGILPMWCFHVRVVDAGASSSSDTETLHYHRPPTMRPR